MNGFQLRPEVKVGIFALVSLMVLAYATIRISDRTLGSSGTYDVFFEVDSAIGLSRKTPVEIAGIQVGVIHDVHLMDSRRARLTLRIEQTVKLATNATARVRSKSLLGDTYIEIVPGTVDAPLLGGGDNIVSGGRYGDVSQLIANLTEASSSLKDMLGPDENAPIRRVVANLDTITTHLSSFTEKNDQNLNEIVRNLAIVSRDLRDVTQNSREDTKQIMARVASIAEKIDKGQGTLGRLINEDETADNINNAASGLSTALGSINRTELSLGYHLEYMKQSSDFKHYVEIGLMPAPDKALLFEFVADPSPSPNRTKTTTDITAGGTTSSVVTQRSVVEQNAFRFSAQLAKSFYDLTLRGGIIESRGGVGMDYALGPALLKFSAFDFTSNALSRPHLKGYANLNLTNNMYLTGGADDFISKSQKIDWFFGAGFRLIDEDMKSLLSLARVR